MNNAKQNAENPENNGPRKIGRSTEKERHDRQHRVEEMLLRGATRNQIAAAIGCTVETAGSDMREITEVWLADDIRTARRRRAKRIRQLEHAAQKAMASYERSRQDAETITTVYRRAKCPDCKGTGFENEGKTNWCPTCKGKGKVTVEDVTKHVKGQAGDSSFLRVFKECIAECAKLEGSYPRFNKLPRNKAPIGNEAKQALPQAHLHLHGVDFSAASPDKIIAAKQALIELTTSAGQRHTIDIESD